MKAKILALIIALVIVVGTSTTAYTTPIDSPETDAIQELLEFYASENLNYIDKMPDSLMQQFGDTIALADRYLQELYGDQVMLSTSKDFVLDQYCDQILLGLFLDLSDQSAIEEIRRFTDAAAKHYINPTGEDRSGERPAIESTEPYTSAWIRTVATTTAVPEQIRSCA